MPKTWFQFTATADNTAEVSIYDEIGLWGVSAKSFVDELKNHTGKNLTVRINSPGGVVTEGLAIFNALKRHKGGVIVQIDGLCASMATYVALAGAPIRMAENSYFMIHNVSGGAYGTAEEIRKAADLTEKMQKGIVAAYVARTGKTVEEIEEKMDEETWFTAVEAKDFGFIDEITDPIAAAATLSEESRALLAKFRHPPSALVDSAAGKPNANAAHPQNSPMKILTASLASLLATMSGKPVTENSAEADVKAALDEVTGKTTALEKDKTDLTAKLTAEQGKVTALETEKTELTGKLTTATSEVTKLKGESKTADQKAQEIAAAHGSLPAGKDHEIAAGPSKDGKALYDEYTKLNGREASEFWAQHSKALIAFGEAEEKKARRLD